MTTSSISFTSAGAQLAAMLVGSEAQLAERNNQSLEALQQRIERQADEEYEQRMAAADASVRAAWFGGAFTIAGGVAKVGAGFAQVQPAEQPLPNASASEAIAASRPSQSNTPNLLGTAGDTLSALAPHAAELGGKVEAERREAKAQRIARSIEQASVESEQVSRRAEREDRRASSAVEAARGFVEAETARSNAVNSNW